MLELEFHAFKAIQKKELSKEFAQGHEKVLVDYGITNITTNNVCWTKDPNVYAIVAIDKANGEIVGGIRVHSKSKGVLLPVEDAIHGLDKRIYNYVTGLSEDEGVGELCALWNSKSVAGQGVSLLLIRAGISIVNQLRLNHLLTICADYTLPLVQRVGFEVEFELGNNGEFEYPNEKYIARVLRKLNAVNIESAVEYDRKRILDLRENPLQKIVEQGAVDLILVEYFLKL